MGTNDQINKTNPKRRVREQTLTEQSLATYMTQVERILNSRPIIPVIEDSQIEDVLTPNRILLPPEVMTPIEEHLNLRERYSRHWKQAILLADTFWKRWMNEYLPLLQTRQKWLIPRRDLKAGDFVLLKETQTSRNSWPKGIITKTSPG